MKINFLLTWWDDKFSRQILSPPSHLLSLFCLCRCLRFFPFHGLAVVRSQRCQWAVKIRLEAELVHPLPSRCWDRNEFYIFIMDFRISLASMMITMMRRLLRQQVARGQWGQGESQVLRWEREERKKWEIFSFLLIFHFMNVPQLRFKRHQLHGGNREMMNGKEKWGNPLRISSSAAFVLCSERVHKLHE